MMGIRGHEKVGRGSINNVKAKVHLGPNLLHNSYVERIFLLLIKKAIIFGERWQDFGCWDIGGRSLSRLRHRNVMQSEGRVTILLLPRDILQLDNSLIYPSGYIYIWNFEFCRIFNFVKKPTCFSQGEKLFNITFLSSYPLTLIG